MKAYIQSELVGDEDDVVILAECILCEIKDKFIESLLDVTEYQHALVWNRIREVVLK